MLIAIIILSIIIVVGGVITGLYIKDLKEKYDKLYKKEKRRQELMVGGKAMYYNYRLETKVTEAEKEKGEKVERFGVDYELEIQEIAKNRAKVKVIDASGTDRYPRDAKNKPALIAFLDGQWVETRNLVMIETKQVYRNKRLNHLLDDD